MKRMKDNHLSNDLIKRMWLTKGARYNAYRRLQKKHNLSISSIGFLSSYVLIINSLKFFNFLHINPFQQNVILFFTMVMSIFILILSLIDSAKDYKLNAEKFLMSATEIENLYNELEQTHESSMSLKKKEDKIHNILERYGNILKYYQINHDAVDFDFLVFNNVKWSLNGFAKLLITYLKAMVFPFLHYRIIILATPLVFVFSIL
jgi:hypothetical protein